MTEDQKQNRRARQKARRDEENRRAKAARSNDAATRVGFNRVILGLVLTAAVVGLGWYLMRGIDVTLGVDTPVVAEGVALAKEPGAAQPGSEDPAIGQQAPVVKGQTPDGTEIVIGAPGKPQLIGFMSHHCVVCQDEVAEFNTIVEGIHPDVELVAVSTRHAPERTNWPPTKWLESEDFPGYPNTVMLDGDDTAADAYGLVGTPMWVAIDADGKIVVRQSGKLSEKAIKAYSALAAGEQIDENGVVISSEENSVSDTASETPASD